MTFDRVKEIVLDCLKCDEGDITLNADLSDDLGADSIDAVDLIMSIEDEFNVTFPEDAATKIKTVGDLVAYIDDKTK